MIKNNFWESLIWIIVWVFILSFIIMWISSLLITSKDNINKFENKNTISILKKNTISIIKKINTNNILENEIFYLYKNNTTKEFETFTWTINVEYKYIDKHWTKINDLANFNWAIYSRILWLERDDTSLWNNHQIIKASIKRLIKK
jgi:hypothetical protein